MVPVCSILIIDSKKMVKRNKHKTENLTCETKHMTRDTALLSSSGAMKHFWQGEPEPQPEYRAEMSIPV